MAYKYVAGFMLFSLSNAVSAAAGFARRDSAVFIVMSALVSLGFAFAAGFESRDVFERKARES